LSKYYESFIACKFEFGGGNGRNTVNSQFGHIFGQWQTFNKIESYDEFES